MKKSGAKKTHLRDWWRRSRVGLILRILWNLFLNEKLKLGKGRDQEGLN